LNNGEGVLLTRDRKQEVNRWTMSEHGPIVQTNIDHWSEDKNMDVMDSIERRALARSSIESLMENGDINKSSLWMVMSNSPICNTITVYGTYMLPKSGYLETRIPVPIFGFLPVNLTKFKDHITYISEDDIENISLRLRDTTFNNEE